jgi:hypothetical protein
MRWFESVLWTLFWLVVVAGVAIWLGLDDLVRASLAAGHLLDWLMGVLCFLWLLVLLKAPWDLYFHAHTIAFEIERARERGIPVPPGRAEYVGTLRQRLGGLAVGAHLFSAALAAGVAWWTGGIAVGYYFAVFYIVSTAFRPLAAAYTYLATRLRTLSDETRYPREDVMELRARVAALEVGLSALTERMDAAGQALQAETEARETEDRDLRQRVHAIGREFETTVSRLTDNQELIKGIQSFVRLVVAQSSAAQP